MICWSRSLSSRAGHEQLRLLGRQRPDPLLQQQVRGHADAGQRRLQLVAHDREHAALHLVEPAEVGDVGQHQRHAEQRLVRRRGVDDRHRVGQEEPLPPALVQHLDGRLVPPRLGPRSPPAAAPVQGRQPVHPAAGQVAVGLAGRTAAGRRRWPVRPCPPGPTMATASGRLLTASCVVRWVRTSLARSVRRNSRSRAAIELNASASWPDLVAALHLHDQVQVALLDLLGRLRSASCSGPRIERLRTKTNTTASATPAAVSRYMTRRYRRGGGLDLAVLVHHVVEVEVDHLLRVGAEPGRKRLKCAAAPGRGTPGRRRRPAPSRGRRGRPPNWPAGSRPGGPRWGGA